MFTQQANDDTHCITCICISPAPLRLTNGEYFFIYNSARVWKQTIKPGWNKQYNAGFLILDGSDPTIVKQRSNVPLLSPEEPWEMGNSSFPQYLTPEVVFIEAAIPDPAYPNKNTFLAFYGAADSAIGAIRLEVELPNEP